MTKLNAKTVAKSNLDDAAKTTEVNIKASELYTTSKAINAATNTASKVGHNLQLEYQRIACSVIKHLDAHKDIRVVRHMMDTLPEGMRKKSMSAFLDKFASVSFVDNEETGKQEINYNKDKASNLVGALVFPWWKAATESKYIPFNLEVELQKLIHRAEGKLKKGVSEDKGDNVTPEQIAQLTAVAQNLHQGLPVAA